MATEGDEQYAKWTRMLKIHECTIESLFSLERLPVLLIKEKLAQTEVLVSNIGDHFGEELNTMWNEKIAKWWMQLAVALEKPSVYRIVQSKGPSPSSLPPSKVEILQKLKHEFSLLEPINDAESHTMTKLLEVVEHARNLTIPFWMDNRLQMDIFDYAFAKLPPVHQARYHIIVDPTKRKKSLRDMRRYLLLQVTLQKDAREWIEREFAQLTVDCDELEDLKKLLHVLNKAANMVFPFDSYTNDAIFDIAFGRLTDDKRELFCCTFNGGPKKSLRNLRKFLDDEIVFTYYKRHGSPLTTINVGNTSKDPVTKEALRAQIELAFGELLPIKNNADIVALKKLFALVCKVRAAIARFRNDAELQGSIFEMALSKLPPEMQLMYGRVVNVEDYKSMLELSKFLVMQIKIYYQDEHLNKGWRRRSPDVIELDAVDDEVPKRVPADAAGSSSILLILCRYCKTYGNHTCNDCPEKKAMTCYKCFQIGHKAKNCKLFESIRAVALQPQEAVLRLEAPAA